MTQRELIPLLVANNPAVALAVAESEFNMNFTTSEQLVNYLVERWESQDIGAVQAFFDSVPYVDNKDSELGQLVQMARNSDGLNGSYTLSQKGSSVWNILGAVFSGLGDFLNPSSNNNQPPPPPPPPPPTFWDKHGQKVLIGAGVVLVLGVFWYVSKNKAK